MIDDLVRKYIALRDKKATLAAEIKAKLEPIDRGLALAEAAILQHLQAVGGESIRTPNGTAYKTTRVSCTVQEWEPLLAWIQENNAWEMLDKRVNKTGVESYKEEHNDLPPGVKWDEAVTVNVRRS